MTVNEAQTEKLEKEVVVNESETTEMVEVVKEDKKAKAKKVGKTALKVAGVTALGVICYALGIKKGRKTQYDEVEIIDAEIIDSDVE